MKNKVKRNSLMLGTLLSLILLNTTSYAATRMITCRSAINSMEKSEPVEPTGPADLSGEYSDRKDPGVDDVSDAFPSSTDNNWDGSSGAGGAWSNEF